ncbi:DUF4169 family protein [Stappia stellulata]|uniref:DUF4169 family protein n=1 Tax=Stappia stellulata TaxID=71235 RepID=UPI00041B4C38|nr:DUF4169 family protein [Stappia stellulata]
MTGGDIINLRKARKTRKRRDKETRAAENRVVFGRTKAERDRSKSEAERTERRIDAHLRKAEAAGDEERGNCARAPLTDTPDADTDA